MDFLNREGAWLTWILSLIIEFFKKQKRASCLMFAS